MQLGGLTFQEALKLEAVALRCDAAAEAAAAFNDAKLLDLTVEAGQHSINAVVAGFFASRRLAEVKAAIATTN
jgi:hypothetical protein